MAFFSNSGSRVTRNALVSIGALGAAALVLAGCGSGSGSAGLEPGPPAGVDQAQWDEIVEAANSEGEVVFYRSLGGMEEVIADFEAAYPEITISDSFAPTGELVQRLDQELEAGVTGADLTMHASPGWFIDRYASDTFGALAVSPDNQEEDWEDRLEGNSYATMFGFPYTLGYRTNNPAPTSLKDLLDENPDVSIGINDPSIAIAVAFAYEELREVYGDEILDQLAAANYKIEAGNTQMAQSLGAGAFEYAYPSQSSTTAPLIASGAPMAEAVTDAAITGAYYNVAVLANAAHPNASLVFANWMMSRDGAESFVEHVSPATVPLDVEGAITWGDVATYDPEVWTTDYWNEWIAENWTPRFG